MNNTVIIFSDEAGQYYRYPTIKNINSDPFYVRSGVYISTEDYISFQRDIDLLKANYGVPNNQELKWSDIYAVQKKRFRNDFLKNYSDKDIMEYISYYLNTASKYNSIKFLFTITKNKIQNSADKDYITFIHLQNIYQRAQLDAKNNNSDFYLVIIDDINEETLNGLRKKCSDLLHSGDRFVQYSNVNQSLLVEKSEQSAGVQLADYSAGIFNSVAKRYILSQHNYDYANSLYLSYIAPHIRNYYKRILGYGIIRITNRIEIENLNSLLNVTAQYL